MRFKLSALLAAAVSLPLLTTSAMADDWEGDYGSTASCGKNVQCWIEIEKASGGNYKVSYVAADYFDFRKEHCRLDFTMKKGKNGLQGATSKGEKGFIVAKPDGELSFNAGKTTCGKFKISGGYHIIGD